MNRLTSWYVGDPDFPSPSQMTPEDRKAYLAAIDLARPRLDHYPGTVTIFGTGGDFEKGDLVAIFYGRPETTKKECEQEVGRLAKYFSAPVWREEAAEVRSVVTDQVDEKDDQQDGLDHLDDRRRDD